MISNGYFEISRPNRRTGICDAAITVLGREGARGLSHHKVDDELGLPRGSTSYYFRTRVALLEAAVQRVSTLDKDDIAGSLLKGGTPINAMARVIHDWLTPPNLTRTRARHELFLIGSRHPSIATHLSATREEMIKNTAKLLLQTWDADMSKTLARHSATIGVLIADGIMFTTVRENRNSPSVAQIETYLRAALQIGMESFPEMDRSLANKPTN